MSRRLARLIVRVSALAAPPRLRDRWREKWLGEIEASASAPVRDRRPA
jgi:hypothetical protein